MRTARFIIIFLVVVLKNEIKAVKRSPPFKRRLFRGFAPELAAIIGVNVAWNQLQEKKGADDTSILNSALQFMVPNF